MSILYYILCLLFDLSFFFQAEDGIRDRDVTGVQTCALPISAFPGGATAGLHQHRRRRSLRQETPETLARKPLTLPHLAGLLRDRHLEHRFRHVDGDRRTIHGDSSFHRRYGRKAALAHPMPFKSREESIT